MPARKSTKSKKAKPAKGKGKAVVKGKCGGWKAVLNMMPPGPWTLRVTGKCVFPNHKHKVTLKDAVPQGINPVILLLKKTVTTSPGIQTPEVVNVSYTKKTKTKYTHVTILPDGVTVKVQIVV